jgi:hypothetical protein
MGTRFGLEQKRGLPPGVIVGMCVNPTNGPAVAVAWYPGAQGYTVEPLAALIDDMPATRPPCGGELCFTRISAEAINDQGQIAVRWASLPYGYTEDADILLLTPRPAAQAR